MQAKTIAISLFRGKKKNAIFQEIVCGGIKKYIIKFKNILVAVL